MTNPVDWTSAKVILHRLRHVKLAKSCMGMQGLIDDAAAAIERLELSLTASEKRVTELETENRHLRAEVYE